MSPDKPTGTTQPADDNPYGLEARAAFLRTIEVELDREAYQLLIGAAADISARGLASVGFDPICTEIMRLTSQLVDKALSFDQRACEFELKTLTLTGACNNPFGSVRERQLAETLSQRVDGTPQRIRSLREGKRVWGGNDPRHQADLCRIEKEQILKHAHAQYGQRRAEFELERKRVLLEGRDERSLDHSRVTAAAEAQYDKRLASLGIKPFEFVSVDDSRHEGLQHEVLRFFRTVELLIFRPEGGLFDDGQTWSPDPVVLLPDTSVAARYYSARTVQLDDEHVGTVFMNRQGVYFLKVSLDRVAK